MKCPKCSDFIIKVDDKKKEVICHGWCGIKWEQYAAYYYKKTTKAKELGK